MNIFYFDECPTISAEAQPDKMLVKMPLETAQMLCTAHRELDGDEYADKFAEVLVDTMFDRIINYVSTNANVTGSFATVPPSGPGAPPTCGPTLLNGAVL